MDGFAIIMIIAFVIISVLATLAIVFEMKED